MKRTIGCVPRAILSATGVEKAQHETPCEALELYEEIKVQGMRGRMVAGVCYRLVVYLGVL
jgi:hypothetical protein